MANGNPRIFGTGGGGMTFQHITMRDTILGIVLPAALMIVQRLLFWLLFFIMVLMVGEQAPALLALSVAVFLYDAVRMGRARESKMAGAMLLISFILCAVAAFDYWPTLLQWQRFDNRFHYRVSWMFHRWWSEWLSLDTGWQPAYWGVVWLRLFAVLVVPAIVWSPARLSDWALGIEIAWPIARETRFAQGDPASIPAPDGYNIRQSSRPDQEGRDAPPQQPPIPQPRSRGS